MSSPTLAILAERVLSRLQQARATIRPVPDAIADAHWDLDTYEAGFKDGLARAAEVFREELNRQ
jgi:hypothetical protein